MTTLPSRFPWAQDSLELKKKKNQVDECTCSNGKRDEIWTCLSPECLNLTMKYQGSTEFLKGKEESSKVSSDTSPENMHSCICYSLAVQWTCEVIWHNRTGFPLAHSFEGSSQVGWLVQLVWLLTEAIHQSSHWVEQAAHFMAANKQRWELLRSKCPFKGTFPMT